MRLVWCDKEQMYGPLLEKLSLFYDTLLDLRTRMTTRR